MAQKPGKAGMPLMALKGKIREEGKSIRILAQEIKMSSSTLCLKINNKSDLSSTEIIKICKALNIDAKDIPQYFFPLMLRGVTKTG